MKTMLMIPALMLLLCTPALGAKPVKKRRVDDLVRYRILEAPITLECAGFVGRTTDFYNGTCEEASFRVTYRSGKSRVEVWQAGCDRKVIRSLEWNEFYRVSPGTVGASLLRHLCEPITEE